MKGGSTSTWLAAIFRATLATVIVAAIAIPAAGLELRPTPLWLTTGLSLAALLVTALLGTQSIKRSGQSLSLAQDVARRAEERYVGDRLDSRRQVLLDALIEASYRTTSWTVANSAYVGRLARYAALLGSDAPTQYVSDAAIAVDDYDTGKLRVEAAEASRAIQRGIVLLHIDNGKAVSADHSLMLQTVLEQMTRAMVNGQVLASHITSETVGQIEDLKDQFAKIRAAATEAGGQLTKLVSVVFREP